MATFDESIKQFTQPFIRPENNETLYEFHDRIYSFIWFMKNYMEGKDINGNYIDSAQTGIKPIEAYYNLVSDNGESKTQSTTTTFFFKKFYNDNYTNGHLMNIPTEAQKKEIGSWIINSIGEDGKINENILYEIIHIDNEYYNIFVHSGDVITTKVAVAVYQDGKNLDTTGDIGRALSDMMLYSKKYVSNNYTYARGADIMENGIDKIILETSIYKLKKLYKDYNDVLDKNNSYISNIYNTTTIHSRIYSIVTSYPITNTGEFTLNKYYHPYKLLDERGNKLLLRANYLPYIVGISDSFKAGGIYMFDPKLAFLIQYFKLKFDDENSNMWNTPYYTTIGGTNIEDIDKGIRITILTLQKYAAIRRYMWSKDPDYASEVYKTDPKDIINELRDPYSLLPYKDEHISEFTKYQNDEKDRRYVPEDIDLTLIPYSIFSGYPKDNLPQLKAGLKKQIDEEIIANWKWATYKSKSIDEIYNELYRLIPHKSDWTLNRPYQDIEKIEIKRIPEVEAIFAPLLAKKEIEYEKKHPEEVKEQEVIFAPQIDDVSIKDEEQEQKQKQEQKQEPEPVQKQPKEPIITRVKRMFTSKKSKGGSRNKTVKKQFKKIVTI